MANSNLVTREDLKNVFEALGEGDYSTRIDALESHDYIVEQGTEGIWTYRKWASGIAECWGTARIEYTGFQAWGNDFETNASVRNINYPTGLFISTPKCNMQIDSPCSYGLYLEVYGSGGSKDRTPNFVGVRPNSVSFSGTAFHNVSVESKGRWK